MEARIRKYLGRIDGIVAGGVDDAITAATAAVARLSVDASQAEFESAVMDAMEAKLGAAMRSKEMQRAVRAAASEAYSFYRITDQSALQGFPAPRSIFEFSGADEKAMAFLGNVDGWYFTKLVDNATLQTPLRNWLEKEYLSEGAALFGRGGDAQREAFRARLGGEAYKLANYEVDRIANSSVQRIRTWGTMEQFAAAKIVEAEIVAVMDDKTSEICQAMDGRIIPIEVAVEAVRRFTDMEPEEFAASQFESEDGKAFNADPLEYIQGKDMAELAAEGRGFPPFHPNCRTDVVYRG